MNNIGSVFFARPWAVKHDVLNFMADVIQRHISGQKLTEAEINERINAAGGSQDRVVSTYEVINGFARIPIYGIIAKRSNMVNKISLPNGTPVEQIQNDLKATLSDVKVKEILLDIDSPGGSVDGIAELSDFIYNARGKKPITAFASGQMASAAYWIGSAANKVYTSKSAEVGSIGIYAVINDLTVAYHNEGIKSVIVKAGKHKATGHPQKQITEHDVFDVQEEVDAYYDLFVQAVRRNRKMTPENIVKIATGKVYIGQQAVDNGLADRIATIENLLGGLAEITAHNTGIRADLLKHNTVSKTAAPGVIKKDESGKSSSDGFAAGARFEQQRILSIQKAAFPGQEHLVKEAIDKIMSLEEAKKLFYDRASIEQRAARDWQTKPEIRKEFHRKETYINYCQAEAKGRIKIIGNRGL